MRSHRVLIWKHNFSTFFYMRRFHVVIFFTQWNYYDFSNLGIHSVYVCVAFTLAETFGVTFGDRWGAEFHAAEHPQYNVGVTTGDHCSSLLIDDIFCTIYIYIHSLNDCTYGSWIHIIYTRERKHINPNIVLMTFYLKQIAKITDRNIYDILSQCCHEI